MFELKYLTPEGVPAALAKAYRYRLLNEPEQAESICHDVLRIEPENQDAIMALVLCLTDRLLGPRPVPPREARDLLPRLTTIYDREYYAGIIDEREGIAWMRSGKPRAGAAAYQCFREAMAHFEKAEAVRPAANDDALLRWNSCARMIANHTDVSPAEEAVEVAADLGE
ncbi:MAG TPA: hypothetical protein VGJ05_12805 [Fimbriiglobus sp.]|jgi:hypothetical protein